MVGNKEKQGGDGQQEGVAGIDAECRPADLAVAPLRDPPPEIPAFCCADQSNYTWSPIDASSAARLAMLDEESRCAYEKLGYLPDLRRYSLGEFRLDENRVVSFEAIPELGEVGYSEITQFQSGTPNSPEVADEATPSPLVRFLQLTDKSVPVPLMLSEFDDRSDDPEVERLLAGRELVDMLDDFGRQLTETPAPPQTAVEPGNVHTCFVGGLVPFADSYCENKEIAYCDNGAWADLTRSSGNKKRYVSHSRIACCAPTGAYAEHQFRYWSWTYWKWKWTAIKYPLPPAAWMQTLGYGDVKYWKHVGSKKRRRKIRVWTGGGAGYFRAWSAFYN